MPTTKPSIPYDLQSWKNILIDLIRFINLHHQTEWQIFDSAQLAVTDYWQIAQNN